MLITVENAEDDRIQISISDTGIDWIWSVNVAEAGCSTIKDLRFIYALLVW